MPWWPTALCGTVCLTYSIFPRIGVQTGEISGSFVSSSAQIPGLVVVATMRIWGMSIVLYLDN